MANTRRTFRPSLPVTAIVVVMLGILISLGTWQIDRAREKQELITRYEAAPKMPVVTLADLEQDWISYRYRRVELRGSYDNQHQILLENQLMQSKSGYMVMTPFDLDDSGHAVLVNRGWLARGNDLQSLPDIEVAGETRQLSGLINEPPGVGIQIGSLDDSMAGWPKSVPYADLGWIELQTGKRLLPWIVLLAPEQPDGFTRSWQPAVRMGPEKHQGYAFQWYSLAIALIFLFVVGSLKPQGDAGSKDTEPEERP